MIIITGSYPPQICGVGDYTKKLLSTQNAKNWKLYYSKNWSLKTLFKHINAINQLKDNIVNIQYPTQGYGWSIVPHMLSLYFSWFTHKKFIVTVHEQSQLSRKARLAEKIILLTANRVIFTNQFERKYAIKRFPYMRQRSTVIKIHSNITQCPKIKLIEERKLDIVNFGHIRPRKGIEEFITEIANMNVKCRVLIAGQIPEGFRDYYESLLPSAMAAGIEFRLNLKENEISELLNDTKVVYLPFPDGASERRGSLLAAMSNGAVVLTTIGKFTTESLKNAIIERTAENSLNSILSDVILLKEKQIASIQFMREQMPESWDKIAEQYNNFVRE